MMVSILDLLKEYGLPAIVTALIVFMLVRGEILFRYPSK